MKKSELKDSINKKGGFTQIYIEALGAEVGNSNIKCEKITEEERKAKKIPEGAIFFKGIASNADLNRNGYIILLEAWKKGIAGYMKNPVVLLGHDMDKPVGRCIKMEVTPDGLYVEGYAYDDYMDQRFSRNLINAMSTGHYTLKFDFINLKTGEILTKTEFRRRFDEFWGLDEKDTNHLDNWVRRITETEIVEFSLVSIPANRKSLVSAREDLENWHKKELETAPVAKNKESADNIPVTTNSMKTHTLTENDLEKYPTLKEKYKVGEAISAKAWESISGEKEEPKKTATDTAAKTTVENPDENAGGDDTPAENADDEGDDTTDDDEEGAGDDDEKDDDPNGEGDDDPADDPNGEGGDDEPADDPNKEEKVKISKTDREKLLAEAKEARKRADELDRAVEATTCEGEEEAPAKTKKPVAKVEVNVLNMEKVTQVVTELVRIIEHQQEQLDKFSKVIENIPAKKALIVHNQFAAAKKESANAKKEKTETADKTQKQVEELTSIFQSSGLAHLLKK